MYIRVNNKKIELIECNTTKDKFKSLKFVLEPIDYGIKIPNKRIASTYFFCQRVDIVFTDKENRIVYLYDYIKSESLIIKLKKYNIYYLPLNTSKYLKKGEILKIKE